MGLKIKKISSIKQAQRASKRGSRDDRTTRISEDGLVVRFLHELDEGTIQYAEHFVEKSGFVTCVEDCDYCKEGMNASTRFLVRALDRTENRVIALVIPKPLMNKLSKRAEKRETIMDVDFELSREGTGRDTEYDLDPLKATKVKIEDYDEEAPLLEDFVELLEKDLEEFHARVNAPREDADDDDDDDDYDDPPFEVDRKKSSRTPERKTTSRAGASKPKRPIPRRK